MLPDLLPAPERLTNGPKLNTLSANGLLQRLLAGTLARARIGGHNRGRDVSMAIIVAGIDQ